MTLILTSLALFLLSSLIIFNYYNRDRETKSIKKLTQVLNTQLLASDPQTETEFQAFADLYKAENLRITVIDLQGKVLADTHINWESADNHLSREEIAEASSIGYGISIRYSNSVKESLIYYALKTQLPSKAVYLRLSTPLEQVNSYFISFLSAAIAVLIFVLILTLIFARQASKSLLRPLTAIKENLSDVVSGKYPFKSEITKYDELNTIYHDIFNISKNLRNVVSSYQNEREKLEFILDNINQGLIAVDGEMHAVMANTMVRTLLHAESKLPAHLSLLIRNEDILESTQKAVFDGEMSVFDILNVDNKILGVEILPVQSSFGVSALILLSDVTAVRKLEIEKNEFFVNASHELSTPLTSILGYSELLQSGRGKDNEGKFIVTIHSEAKRMKSLVEDMLKLSKFENAPHEELEEKQDFKAIVESVIASYETKAKEHNIQLIRYVEPCELLADREKLFELVSNLVDNAIKYNNDGGKAEVTLRNNRETVTLTVKDTGIGIPQKYQYRVFERFFRVDKGRSRKAGGTGLGLAIVKHICSHYNAQLTLKSTEGVGTEITVLFKKKH